MYEVKRLLENINIIKEKNPRYRNGGIGTDGTCDCIGMIMGAMYMMGRGRYDMHSSNYFSRYQMQELLPIYDPADCYLGMVVYKSRAMGNSAYGLHERYKQGGRYFTGDLLDYYHVGVVTSVNPLNITHCTEYAGVSGIVVDTKLGKWQCGGRLYGVNYSELGDVECEEPGAGEEIGGGDKPQNLTGKNCKVVGGALNVRAKKDTKSTRICQVPDEAIVLCEKDEGEWSKVRYEGADNSTKRVGLYKGYAVTRFLQEMVID